MKWAINLLLFPELLEFDVVLDENGVVKHVSYQRVLFPLVVVLGGTPSLHLAHVDFWIHRRCNTLTGRYAIPCVHSIAQFRAVRIVSTYCIEFICLLFFVIGWLVQIDVETLIQILKYCLLHRRLLEIAPFQWNLTWQILSCTRSAE